MADKVFKVGVIGAGGLGTPACLGLLSSWPAERAGVIRIFDQDQVELSNLNRQVLFGESDIGSQKSALLKRKLLASGFAQGKVALEAYAERVTESNIWKNLSDLDLVIEATDSVTTKFLTNDFCAIHRKAFCYAGVSETTGLLLFVPPGGACLRCLFADVPGPGDEATCQTAGIFGAIAGDFGYLQA